MIRPQHKGANVSYSEILRVIGMYVDRNNLAEARVLETQEGMILQGRLTQGANTGQIETYQLTSEDILALLQDAYARRGKKF